MKDQIPQPAKRDAKAPRILEMVLHGSENDTKLLALTVPAKHFKTGSVGYYAASKFTNPESGERYQVAITVTLIGSKPTGGEK